MLKNVFTLLIGIFGMSTLSLGSVLPTVQCEISQNGNSNIKFSKLQVEAPVCIDSSCNPTKSVSIGDRVVTLSSSGGELSVVIADKELQFTGPAAFMAQYGNFDGSKAKGGFTGKITVVPTNPPGQNYDSYRIVTFQCYKLEAQ